MNVKVSAIELDTSIQCRAVIDTGVINDYAERMTEGDTFPPVELFGTEEKCWIGDGWHRTLAAKSIERESIEANLNPGGRADALKHALGANAANGLHRSNADKRRCVEIALREFPKMSSRAVAKMCGVSDHTVEAVRPVSGAQVAHVERTGQDGKHYTARRHAPETLPDVKLAITVDAAGAIRSVQPYEPRAKEPRQKTHYEQALEEGRDWMVRWSHIGALAPVFDALTAVIEQSKK